MSAPESHYRGTASLTHAWAAMRCENGYLSLSVPLWAPSQELAEDFARKMGWKDYALLEFRHGQLV
jgi:hypothetical protein